MRIFTDATRRFVIDYLEIIGPVMTVHRETDHAICFSRRERRGEIFELPREILMYKKIIH
jgi:hypothetical protein